MFRTIFLIAFALSLAIGGGAASAWVMIDRGFGFGAVDVGPWTAFPDRGTPAADPYSRARFARRGHLAIGQAEGIVFTATRDSLGEPLTSSCTYQVEGPIPPSRLWTLHAAQRSNGELETNMSAGAALHSLAILRREDGSFNIPVSRHPAPGNRLRVSDSGGFALVLTLYDTAVATTARAVDVELPLIRRLACD
ncbi:MAG: DUF1214 domain-containing protein [Rhizobiaceae bacterium]